MVTSTAMAKYSGWLPVLEAASITIIPAANDAATTATNDATRTTYRGSSIPSDAGPFCRIGFNKVATHLGNPWRGAKGEGPHLPPPAAQRATILGRWLRGPCRTVHRRS